MHLLPAAGPRSTPLAWPVRLILLAWVQLAALAFAASYGAFVLAYFAPRDSLMYFGRLQVLVLISAVAAVVIAHRHHRGKTSRAAAVTTLLGAIVNAVAIDGSLLLSV